GTLDATAYDLYLQGRYYFDLRTGASLTRAAEAFERALARDSTFARACAAPPDSYCTLAHFGTRPAPPLCPPPLPPAPRPPPPLLRTRLGTALMRAGRLPEAITEVRQALALDSTYSEGWRSLALFYVVAGAADSGAAILRAHQAPIGLLAYAAAKAGRREETQ